MSIQDCYNRGESNCPGNDNLCVLEYNPDRQNPTCVPANPNMFHVPSGTSGQVPTLTDSESDFLQLVLVRLLPSGVGVTTATLNQAIKGLAEEVRPRVNWRLRKLMSEGNYSSWGDLVENVSREIIDDINNTECPICTENVKDPPLAGISATLVQNECCSAIYHTSCLQGWSSMHTSCPICRKPLPAPPAGQSLTPADIHARNERALAISRVRDEARRIARQAQLDEWRDERQRNAEREAEFLVALTIALVIVSVMLAGARVATLF